jgi:hypothetical protein
MKKIHARLYRVHVLWNGTHGVLLVNGHWDPIRGSESESKSQVSVPLLCLSVSSVCQSVSLTKYLSSASIRQRDLKMCR